MKKVLFVLSPSLALYNHWKNLLKEIASNGDEIDIFLPKPITYENIINDLYLINEELGIKEFLILYNPLNPFSIKKLTISNIQKLTRKKFFKLQVFIRSLAARIINKFSLKCFKPFLGDLIRYISSIKILRYLLGNNIFRIKYETLLYDIFEEKKYYIFPYLTYFYQLQRFSLFHGSGISSTHIFFDKPFWSYLNRLQILDYTGLNKSQYLFNLSMRNFKYQIIGVPNHFYQKNNLIDSKSKTISKLKAELNLKEETKFMTLTSRPDDNTFCNSDDRKNYLKKIGSYLAQNKNWHLLIKAHPKEKTYSEELWSHLLGVSKNQNYFSFTKKSSLELACISDLGFSFVSTCCIDFASFGTPMIELTSLKQTKFRHLTTFFSYDGFPLTGEAFHKLTINVKNIDELKLIFSDLEKNIRNFSETVDKAYRTCYGIDSYTSGKFLNLMHSEF